MACEMAPDAWPRVIPAICASVNRILSRHARCLSVGVSPRQRTLFEQIAAASASEPLKAFIKTLTDRAERLRTARVDPSVDNMLKITGDGRKAALDMRLVDPFGQPDGDTKLMLAVLRLRGVPCRYVSGYLHIEGSAVEPAQSHAWIEFYSPRAGWIPFDPTHDREVDERYVVVAHGRHYDDVPPNRGIYRGNAKETLRAEVRTQVTAGKDTIDLHEEIRQIDLPVFHEPPERRRLERVITRAEEAAIQQQQQQ